MEVKPGASEPPLHVIAPDGDLIVTLTESEKIYPTPEEGEEYKQVLVAKFKVDRSTLINLPAEDNRQDNFFKRTLGGFFKEARETTMNIQDEDANALAVFFFVAHKNPESAYAYCHAVMWPLSRFLDFANVPSKIFEKWFAGWYECNLETIHKISPREMLYPCHKFDYAPGFSKATKDCVYGISGYVHEKNPTDCRTEHLHPVIIRKSYTTLSFTILD